MAHDSKRFCYISKYIKETDPGLAKVLDDACMMGQLRPRRDHTGMTFIYPAAHTIKELQKLSDNDELEKVIEIMLNHVVHYFIPSVEKWNEYKSDIPNGHNRKMSVKVAGKSVTVDGAKIVLDTKFRQFVPSGKPSNQVVWRIEGKDTLASDIAAEKSMMPYAKVPLGSERKTEGGGLGRAVGTPLQFIYETLDKYVSHVFHPSGDESGSMKIANPVFEHLCSMLCFLRDNHRDVYLSLVQHLTPAPLSAFIFLFSNVSESVFSTWYRNRMLVDDPVAEWRKCLDTAAAELKADPAAEIADAPFDVTKANYGSKINTYYEQLATSRGGITGPKLFAYHLAAFKEVSSVYQCEDEVMASRSAGVRLSGTIRDYHSDVMDLVGTIQDPKHIILGESSRIIDSDCIATIIGIFHHSDLWGWRLHRVDDGSLELKLRPADGSDEDIPVASYLWTRNRERYASHRRDHALMVAQLRTALKSLTSEERAAVLA